MIFYILFAGAFIFLCIASYFKWHSVHKEYSASQTNLVKLVSNATHALFLSQEMTLNILGHQILKDNDSHVMDRLLVLNPSIIAFGFVDTDGNYQTVSSNFNKVKLPNLRELEASKDSFEYTMTQKKMVLGRSYFVAASGRWGIPIRKSIYDKDGTLAGVMTAGLAIEGAFKIFTENLSIGDYNKVMLIRDRDQYLQYESSSHETPKELYQTPLPHNFMDNILTTISQKYGIPFNEIKQKPIIYELNVANEVGKLVKATLKYNPRYELWILSEVDHDKIISDFKGIFFGYIFVFIFIHIILFFLFRMIAKAEEKRRKDLVFQATHDVLTNLPNRNYLQQNIQDWIYTGAPPFSLCYLDMDHFKNVNDSFGHEFGDILLVELTKRITSLVDRNSIVIRQGGDEFIILSNHTDNKKLLSYAQIMLDEISKPYHIKEFDFVIGVSIGIAKYPENGNTLDMLLRAADIAMYEAKKHRNSVRLFADTMQAGYLNRMSVEHELRKALDKNEFHMVYQPQIDNNGNIYGVEALVRWKNEKLGIIPPDIFIPIAEASGFMPQLGYFIMNRTLSEMRTLQLELGISFQISLNISIKQFIEVNFLERLIQETDHLDLSHISLCLEITESLFIEDIEYILPLLEKIRAMGFSISMDDFGTGYSSLSMLKKLPIDELKIDKSFIDTILHDINSEKMVQNIITIGKNLDLAILAEGVETKEQEKLLKEFGCDCFQGYLYAKPLEYDVLKDFFRVKN
ncbi:bifunctional diguanylate cyclase/phosphodiesterase [Sulfurospirillum arcachonense]|uniref:bifunctional diguanylate cyclase/phosphodiesterase n=1 Tax=Sulfurospirillum arcachonense TaxID=57666 RepID=UPI001FE125B0|nr:EAL domain-containing protein [Sulfurospirillum arcachonense]